MENLSYKVNPKYKDRLFRLIFGDPEMKENMLSLYNALNSTNYTEEDLIEITTLEDVLYIKMKNDMSLLLDSYLSLWEQQSTFNPNMPLRGFFYFGELYSGYLGESRKVLHGRKLVKIPTPRYVVFYNGTEEVPPVVKLKLSDSFIHLDDSGEFEWTATMYNLNVGKNDELLAKCKPLADYMALVNYIREYQKSGLRIELAVDKAVTRCIEEDILANFLRKHRTEVKNMSLLEFDEKIFESNIREEGYEDGVKDGMREGMREGMRVLSLFNKGKLTVQEAAEELGMTEEDFRVMLEQADF